MMKTVQISLNSIDKVKSFVNEITKYDIESISSHFHEKLKPEQLSEILSTADIDSDGRITENDFMNLMRHTNYI